MISETLLGVIIGGVIGFVSSIVVSLFWSWYTRPIVSIERVPPVVGGFDLASVEHKNTTRRYYANRMTVENKGRSAAENCKAYIVIGGNQERVSWMIPSERPTVTLNAHDIEYVDLCAIRNDGGRRIASTEHGWGNTENESRDLGHDVIEIELKVTAKNSQADTKRIRILNTVQNEGRIVEFI